MHVAAHVQSFATDDDESCSSHTAIQPMQLSRFLPTHWLEQGKAEQVTEKGKAEQGKAEQGKAEQGKGTTEQGKAEQGKAEQNREKQSLLLECIRHNSFIHELCRLELHAHICSFTTRAGGVLMG